jgi:translation initiation factor 6
MIIKSDFNGSPHIGVFCLLNDHVAFVPYSVTPKFEHLLKAEFGVSVVKTSLAGTSLLGIFACINNSKIIVSDIIEKEETKVLEDHVSEVVQLNEKYTALGNLISLNDHGAVCSRYIKSTEEIPAKQIKVADSDLIGSAIYSNNHGFLAHRDASQKELEEIQSVLKVKGDIGTLNFGDPLVKSGIIGNKRGVIVGKNTSGPEMQRVDEVFMLK